MRVFINLLGTLLLVTCFTACASVLTVTNTHHIPTAQLQKKIQESQKPLWRIPLGPALVDDMQFIADDKLLVGLRKYSHTLPGLHYMMVNPESGKMVWQFDTSKMPDNFGRLAVTSERLLLYAKSAKGNELHAYALANGQEVWTLKFSAAAEFFPLEAGDRILVLETDKQKTSLNAFSMQSGQQVWQAPELLPKDSSSQTYLLLGAESVYACGRGVKKLDVDDGKVLWEHSEITLNENSPSPTLTGRGTLLLVDRDTKLIELNNSYGKTLLSKTVDSGVTYTNLYSGDGNIYLRGSNNGAGKNNGGDNTFTIIALGKKDGRQLWTYQSEEPTSSNILEYRNKVYIASATKMTALDQKSGKVLFSGTVTSTGHTYPISLRAVGDRIIYIGELVIAAYNYETGRGIYRQGITPITHLNFLDVSIKNKEKNKTKASSQKGFSWASFYSQEAAKYQNIARKYFKISTDSYEDSHTRELANIKYTMSKQSEKTASMLAFSAAMEELGEALGEAFKGMAEAAELKYDKFLRKSILNAYTAAEENNFVFRPYNDNGISGVKIVNLQNGMDTEIALSPAYENFGLWNIIDFKKRIVYHHGIGFDPAFHDLSEPLFNMHMVSAKMHNSYLIAVPIEVP